MKELVTQAKLERRNTRLVRLYVLSEAYNKYQKFYLSQCTLNHDSDYKSAENTSMFINKFFNGETVPSDFIKTEEQSINDIIEKHKEYQEFISNTHLDKSIIDAFCKASEHGSNTALKINSIPFNRQIATIALYNVGQITKEEAEEHIVDYCIFTNTNKKLNTRLFKRTVQSIEELYTEILNKKIIRLYKK
jgi:hypothetical protein